MKVIGWITSIVLGLIVLGACVAVLDDSTPSKPKTPSVADTGKPAPKPKSVDEFPDGDYIVGTDIPAGTYESDGASPGLFEYCDVQTDGSGPNGDGFGQWENGGKNERIIIILTEADGKLSVGGCQPLAKR